MVWAVARRGEAAEIFNVDEKVDEWVFHIGK